MANKTDINPSTGQPYAVNPATGQWDDNYWATVVEPQLKGLVSTGDPTTDLINQSINEYEKKYNEYTQKYKEFDEKNPFIFDNVLSEEKTKVSQRLDPYYTQTLNDYLRGVEMKRTRSLEDERTLLSDLSTDVDRTTGNLRMQIEDAVNNSREGYADAGLYNSGARLRAEGKIGMEGEEDMASILRGSERKKRDLTTDTQRFGQDLALDESTKRRELEKEKSYNIESQALPEVERRRSQREFERGQYTGAPPGVDPLQYENTLYSYLR